MRDDLQRVSEALAVPLRWLLGLLLFSFAMPLAAVVTRSETVRVIAAMFGLCVAVLGIRAALRPSRPFRLETFSSSPWINTTRRVGGFYVTAGVCYAVIASPP
jgi:hypothetical protein